jgi:SAM-dependent methyltransferase
VVMPIARNREPEWMDQPDLDEADHRQALVGLATIHRASRTVAPLWKVVRELAELAQARPEVPLRVLDVACGGGDVAVQIALRARAAGLSLVVSGCDVSPTAVRHARQQAELADATEVTFFQVDVLREPLDWPCDLALCTLFLHHLDETDAVGLFRTMAAVAERGVLVDDLRRTWLGLGLAWAGCRLLSRSPIVHADGPRSVRAAFTGQEALQIAARAGLAGARITHHWPQRFLLDWRRF